MPSSVLETAVEYDPSAAVVPNPTLTWTVANPAIATATTPGVTSIITAVAVGNTTFHVADTSRGVVSPDYTIIVKSSLGWVVVPAGAYLSATVPALAGPGSAGFATLGIRKRFKVDALLSGTGAGMFRIAGGTGSIAVNTSIASGLVGFAGTFNSGLANANFGTFAQSALPAAGNGVVLYAVYVGGSTVGTTGAAILLTTDAGTVLFAGNVTGSSLGAVGNTPAGATTVDIGDFLLQSSAETIDGVEITSALISTPNTPPLPTDPSAIIGWGFAGTLAPTFGAGTFAPVGGTITYQSGGIWS